MSQWGTSDSGILRKNRADENLDNLLVFGYSCKIFRDDEKALYIDQGKHLIPWMGDESLKIDRYDGRGTLSDLRRYEASREGYDALRWMGLSETEKRLEELCDSERYYSLEINEEEEEMYKEEVAKRQKTNAIGFNYDSTGVLKETVPTEGIPTVPEKEEEDEPYKASPVLDVPVDINVPQTVKEYARIEKTALFVCRQGPQMEILIKAKQADNPQFSFLTVHDPLYKFYRHVLSAFKNGRYQPQCEKRTDEPDSDQHHEDDHDSHYLHPSLVSASAKSATPPLPKDPPIPNVPYRPSADCAYSQLVNRIQGNSGQPEQSMIVQGAALGQQGVSAGMVGGAHAQQADMMAQMTMEQQYHHYYYVQQFYEYWRHAVLSGEQGAMYAGLPTEFSQLDQNMQSYIHQMAWAQFVQHYQKQMQEAQEAHAKANNNSYAQIVSNLNKDGVNPYTANVPQLPPPEPQLEEPKPAPVENKPKEERTVTVFKPKENEVKKPLLSLAAAYGSGSESESGSSDSDSDSETDEKEPEEQIEVYRAPVGETQTVIDKMAEYVFKNGSAFEDIIREKGDPRFEFLNEGHEFNKYYRAKLRELKGEPEEKEVKKKVEKKPPKPKKVIAPVSFSIKKPKEEPQKEIKSALPVEDSSDEESYLDHITKSPQNNTAAKTTTATANNNNNSTSQKVPGAPKIGPLIYRLASHVAPEAKKADEEGVKNDFDSAANDRLSPQKEVASKERSKSPTTHSRTKRESTSPRKRSRSRTPNTRRSRTPRKRSASPRKSPIPPKRSKSRSQTPGIRTPPRNRRSPSKKRSPSRSKVSPSKSRVSPSKSSRSPSKSRLSPSKSRPTPSKSRQSPSKSGQSPSNSRLSPSKSRRSPSRNKLSPVKESPSPVKKVKKPPVIDMFDVGEVNGNGTVEKDMNGVLEKDDPILEMLELEKEEKTAEEKAADAKEKARQLERKRKAAMFLKLKSVGNAATTRPSSDKRDRSSPGKSQKASPVKSEKSVKSSRLSTRSSSRSSRRDSDDSVQIISSRSESREKSITKEKIVPRAKSRSRSKGSRSIRRSRSKERKKDSKKRKKSKERARTRSKDRDDDRRVRKEKKKKSHKRKHSKSKEHDSKSKKKSKKHKRSRSRSRSRTPVKSRSISRNKSVSRAKSISRSTRSRSVRKDRSRSRSVQSHISIDSS